MARYITFAFVLMVDMMLLGVSQNLGQEPTLEEQTLSRQAGAVRVATVNGSLYRDEAGQLADELETGNSEQAKSLAVILQTVRPDIVLINEIDFESDHRAVKALIDFYLLKPQSGAEGENLEPLDYKYFYAGPVNTGVASGLDLSGDGFVGGPNDAWGYGKYPGQYGMVVISRFEILRDQVRTFQHFKWCELPGAMRPIVPNSGKSFYSDEIWKQLRLSSKSHWDVPVKVGQETLHILASHPTPPAFDGPEDRNGCRNHDEIRFWTEYISPQSNEWIIDDDGVRNGLNENAPFVIVGDLNADPVDGSGIREGIVSLLAHPRTRDTLPRSKGAIDAATELGQSNRSHKGDASFDTSQFSPNSVGNLRVDFCLPSSNLNIAGSGVFWPEKSSQHAKLVEFTDHRLVWCDILFDSDTR